MTVVFVASECSPIAKVGGLADVVGSLPKALVRLGIDVKIVIPNYGVIDKVRFREEKVGEFEVFFADKLEKFGVFKTLLPNSTSLPAHSGLRPSGRSGSAEPSGSKRSKTGRQVEVFLIDHSFFSNGIYLDLTATPKSLDEVKRFAFLSISALEFLNQASFKIDIIHSHDWHTALIPTLLKLKFKNAKLGKTATVLTIHNLGEAYQGVAKGAFLHSLDLEPESVNLLIRKFKVLKRLNIFARLNFLEQGIETADLLNTVSPQYAQEIKQEEFGGKLTPILQKRANELYGILNGIDYETFNPETDKNLITNYGINSWPQGKAENKKALEQRLGLPTGEKILVGMVTRLDEQKGLELVLEALPELKNLGVKLAILGKGSPALEQSFATSCQSNPKDFSCTFQFDTALANQIYAGADCFLMPSRYEPCGLGQMIAAKYGTIPVVRDVGGLHNTIEDGVTGFKFGEFSAPALLNAVKRAIESFNNKNLWSKMVETAMRRDFSWDKSAAEYVKLYRKAIALRK